ncbi:acyl-CoA dehydratase activase [Proteiniborus sp. MB09-C3]|uniref:acyl-CoA dehydratase activase n=1 Tax=Proteiniborus sp. MB09-C3 TaxID=3050072 RepID=UPI002555D430|nr:acyl-CoA dehydratase activase [Proteiniborus sp. MB09-C3]WIV11940.1 acyl-CoA dehydratase activase [Proteiniborus sp. MB09-C3]
MNTSYYLGVDIGSASSKAVLMNKNREIIHTSVVQLGTGTSGPKKVIDELFSTTDLSVEQVSYTVATGYGRYSLEYADKQFSEISCHAKGINFVFKNVRTVLDIGGQDVKAISIDEKGKVLSFYMNDKCAAGTGRFLEVMARILETPIDELDALDELSQNPATVSSTCTVFAESEVISLLSKDTRREDIARGVHNSIVNRALGLLYRTSMEKDFSLTGGVAQNQGVVRALERALKQKVYVAKTPQLIGAIGAALFAVEFGQERSRI